METNELQKAITVLQRMRRTIKEIGSGPATIFARNVENGYTGGCGIRTLEPDDARAWMERAGCGAAAFELAGLELEEA